jgi:hypothetical protein
MCYSLDIKNFIVSRRLKRWQRTITRLLTKYCTNVPASFAKLRLNHCVRFAVFNRKRSVIDLIF